MEVDFVFTPLGRSGGLLSNCSGDSIPGGDGLDRGPVRGPNAKVGRTEDIPDRVRPRVCRSDRSEGIGSSGRVLESQDSLILTRPAELFRDDSKGVIVNQAVTVHPTGEERLDPGSGSAGRLEIELIDERLQNRKPVFGSGIGDKTDVVIPGGGGLAANPEGDMSVPGETQGETDREAVGNVEDDLIPNRKRDDGCRLFASTGGVNIEGRDLVRRSILIEESNEAFARVNHGPGDLCGSGSVGDSESVRISGGQGR